MYNLDKLKDKEFMTKLFWKKRSEIDERINKIISLDIKKIKFYQDKDFQHAVMNYRLNFYDKVGWQQFLNIYASAHSDGSRARSFKFMQHIYNNGFSLDKYYSSTKPLFYYRPLKASFHQELMGQNIRYIIEKYPELLKPALQEAGKCLALFHKIPFPTTIKMKKYPFSRHFLDPSNIIAKQKDLFVSETILIEKTYKKLEKIYRKQKSFSKNNVFAHGDFHFENVIIGTDFANHPLPFKKVGIIDYTDICAADRGLDLGSFMQKINFMCRYKLNMKQKEVAATENLFLNSYLKSANIQLDSELEKSILFWKTWNNLRVIVNYMLFPEKKQAMDILKESLNTYTTSLFRS